MIAIAIDPNPGICFTKSPTRSKNSAPPFNSPPRTIRPNPTSYKNNIISVWCYKRLIYTHYIHSALIPEYEKKA